MMGRKAKNLKSAPDSETDIGVNWVQCTGCSRWDVYENYMLPEPFNAANVKKKKLECMVCELKANLKTAETQIQHLRDIVNELKKTSDAVESSWADIVKGPKVIQEHHDNTAKELAELKQEILVVTNVQQTTQTGHTTLSAPQLRQATDEIAEIEKRKLNLVVSGLPEEGNDVEAILIRVNNTHDLSKPLVAEDIESITRLGKSAVQGRPRLLKVRFHRYDVRREVLTKSRRTTEREITAVYIRPDMTRAQLEMDKKLREEWKNAGKDSFMIQKGKVVPRTTPFRQNTQTHIGNSKSTRTTPLRQNNQAHIGNSNPTAPPQEINEDDTAIEIKETQNSDESEHKEEGAQATAAPSTRSM